MKIVGSVAVIAAMLTWWAGAQTNTMPVPMPPPVPQVIVVTNNPFVIGTNVYRYLKPPDPHTNLVLLSWDEYTNLQTVVQGTVDWTNWYEKARVPIGVNRVCVPATNPAEFFRIYLDYRP